MPSSTVILYTACRSHKNCRCSNRPLGASGHIGGRKAAALVQALWSRLLSVSTGDHCRQVQIFTRAVIGQFDNTLAYMLIGGRIFICYSSRTHHGI